MANTLGTKNGTLVVMETLETLLATFPILSQIARDFSDEQAKLNQTITTRVVVPTVAEDFVEGTGYAATGQTAVDVSLTMSGHAHATYEVTDREQSETSRDLRREFAAVQAHALGTKLVMALLAGVTAAKFPLSYEQAAVNFDRTDVRKVKTLLNKAKVPDIGRFMLLNSDYAEGVSLDSVVVANPSGANAGVLTSGQMPRIDNFGISEFTDLPDNGERLAGIAGNREALLMALRVPEVPAEQALIPGRIRVVTEPNTGLSVQQRTYYDMKLGKLVESLTVFYGVGVGYSEAGSICRRAVRIVTP